MNRIHPESPEHPQQLRMKRLINQMGDQYWKWRADPTKTHWKKYEDSVNTFAKMLIKMRGSKNGVY